MNNLLSQAFSVIPKVSFQVKRFKSKIVNGFGIVVPVYYTPVTVRGIIQAVENSAYQALGLDLAKNYITAWANYEMQGLDTHEVADQIIYNGRKFNVIKRTDWTAYNGWNQVLAVEDKQQ